MGALCEALLASAIKTDCAEAVKKGFEQEAVIMNRADIDFSSSTLADNSVSIVLKSGKTGYACYQYGNDPYTGTKSTFVEGTYFNTWTHVLALVVPEEGSLVAKNIIDKLAQGEFVVVVRNKYQKATESEDGYKAFRVYGWENGLRCTASEQDKYSDDTHGGFSFELTEEGAQYSEIFLSSDEDTAFEALLG